MNLHRLAPLTGISLIALSAPLHAQEISQSPGVIVLAPITLIAEGEESVEATGGVIVSPEGLQALQPGTISDVLARVICLAKGGRASLSYGSNGRGLSASLAGYGRRGFLI